MIIDRRLPEVVLVLEFIFQKVEITNVHLGGHNNPKLYGNSRAIFIDYFDIHSRNKII
jgi:hypothetical protein